MPKLKNIYRLKFFILLSAMGYNRSLKYMKYVEGKTYEELEKTMKELEGKDPLVNEITIIIRGEKDNKRLSKILREKLKIDTSLKMMIEGEEFKNITFSRNAET